MGLTKWKTTQIKTHRGGKGGKVHRTGGCGPHSTRKEAAATKEGSNCMGKSVFCEEKRIRVTGSVEKVKKNIWGKRKPRTKRIREGGKR